MQAHRVLVSLHSFAKRAAGGSEYHGGGVGSSRRSAVSQSVDRLRLLPHLQANNARQMLGPGTQNTAAARLTNPRRLRSLLSATITGVGLLIISAASKDRLVHHHLVHPGARRPSSGEFATFRIREQTGGSEWHDQLGSRRGSAVSQSADHLRLLPHLQANNAHQMLGPGMTNTAAVRLTNPRRRSLSATTTGVGFLMTSAATRHRLPRPHLLHLQLPRRLRLHLHPANMDARRASSGEFATSRNMSNGEI